MAQLGLQRLPMWALMIWNAWLGSFLLRAMAQDFPVWWESPHAGITIQGVVHTQGSLGMAQLSIQGHLMLPLMIWEAGGVFPAPSYFPKLPSALEITSHHSLNLKIILKTYSNKLENLYKICVFPDIYDIHILKKEVKIITDS